jgi:hypothetical protein
MGPLIGRRRLAWAADQLRVWDAARSDTITSNIDATLLAAHPEKERGCSDYKHGFGFHPLACWLDETGEVAAIPARGTPGSSTAADHFIMPGLALEQRALRERIVLAAAGQPDERGDRLA